MNKKAEVFKAYLDKKDIKCFTVEELADDQLNSVIFRSSIEVEGQSLPTVVILDSSIYSMIRVQIAGNVLREDNEVGMITQLNKLNRQYKVFKYYLSEDGSVFLDSCVLNRGSNLEPEMIYTVLDVIINHLNEEYKNIMKLIWS